MAVNIKMGVDMSGFKAGIADANAQLKTFDAQLKYAETAMKQAGNAEQGMVTKANALEGKLKTQKQLLQQYTQQLQRMREAGVDPLSKDYQKLQAAMLNTKTSMMETEAALNGLSDSQADAAKTADELTNSMNGLNKKVSLEQVRSGISSITSGLENAAKKAVDFGEKLFSVIMDSAAQADDISTLATRLGLTDEQVQKMMYVADRFEAPVEQMAKTWKKVKNNMASDSDEIAEAFARLGIATHEIVGGKYGDIKGAARDYMDVFWEIGEALMQMDDASEQERLATQLLGRSWDEMIPLFKAGREAYEAALKNAPVAGEEAVENAASLNDRVKELEKSWDTLKLEVVGAIAPALEAGANALAGVLDKITEFLQTDDGKKLLEDLGTAVSNLFSDLSNISTEDVVNNVTGVLNGLTGGLEWLYDHWEDVKNALTWIVRGWAALEITGGVLDIVKVVSGLGDLVGIKAAGTAAGSSWGSAFGAAVLKAVPWLAGLITLLTPADTESNSLADAEGNLTAEGLMVQEQEQEHARIQEERDTRRANGTQTYDDWLLEMAQKYIGDYLATSALYENFAFQAAQEYWDKYRTHTATTEDWQALNDAFGEGGDAGRAAMLQIAKVMYTMDKTVEDLPKEAFGMYDNFEEAPIIQIDPIPPEDAAEKISSEIGEVPITLVIRDIEGAELEELLGPGHANGLSFVPNNGLYLLHKGEQVVPAREVASRSYSSNLYVESMYMNNNTDAEGLASAMAAAQRRTMSGYGS